VCAQTRILRGSIGISDNKKMHRHRSTGQKGSSKEKRQKEEKMLQLPEHEAHE